MDSWKGVCAYSAGRLRLGDVLITISEFRPEIAGVAADLRGRCDGVFAEGGGRESFAGDVSRETFHSQNSISDLNSGGDGTV